MITNIIIKNKTITFLLICVIGGLVITGFIGADNATNGEPEEVIKPSPDPLPAIFDTVRAGHWIHGINWPWDNYGGDFGFNLWGYRGLANQGPSGWRRDTREGDDKARRLFGAQRDGDDYCMGVDVELIDTLTSAVIYFQIDELADKAKEDTTFDLTGQTISVELYLPFGIEGSPSARNGAVLFFQDADWTWAETPWMNIELDSTNKWIPLSANLDDLAAQQDGFDQSQIRRVGIKIGANREADIFPYTGPFYVDNLVASAALEIQFDFSSPNTRTEEEMMDVASLNVEMLRWWLFADGRAGLQFDNDGFVTGLDSLFFNDFREMIRLARSSKVYLIPVLFDFLIGAEAHIIDGVQTFGRADLISNPAKRHSLLENAVSVIFDSLANINEVVIIDLFNEPEWLLSDKIDSLEDNRPSEIRKGGVVDLNTMKTFFSEIIDLHKQKGLEGKQLLTIGSASPQWVTLWEDLNLDIVQFHLWNGPGQIDDGFSLDSLPPISGVPTFLGEFSTLLESPQNTCEILEKASMLGYSGAFPWAYRAKDDESLPLLGDETRKCLTDFPTSLAMEPFHNELPRDFALEQNYPNPFNPTTTIRFDLPKTMHVTLTIYNLMGQKVATLVSDSYSAGNFATTWDATGFSSGVYVYQLRAGTYTETRKLLLVNKEDFPVGIAKKPVVTYA